MDHSPTDQNDTPPIEEPRLLCTNCGKKMAKKGKFCPHCGQKRFEGKIPLKDLFSKFFYKLTNLDSKLLRMMWRLFIPGQVTLDYFSGKIKQYPHPFQFFFVVMFFFLLVFNKTTDFGSKGIRFNLVGEDANINLNGGRAEKTPSQIKQSNFYFLLERYVFAQQILKGYDLLPARLQTREVSESLKIIVDSTNGRWTRPLDEMLPNEADRDSLSLNFGPRIVKVALKDIVEYSPDEIIARYQIQDWLGKTLIKQGIRSVQNPRELIAAYIGSFSWTILALVIVMAALMQLLYWRQKRYYVEHFVLLLHWYSGILLGLTLFMGIDYFFSLGTWWRLIFVSIFIFLWLTLKRYYGQNWLWTTWKWLCLMLFYPIGFAFFFLLGLLAVFMFF